MRPLVNDQQELNFWLRHVHVNVITNVVVGGLVGLYVWGRPPRPGDLLLTALLVGAFGLSAALLVVPWGRILRHRLAALFVYGWGGLAVLFVAAGVLLDGGASSPLTLLFFLPLISAAMAWQPFAVVGMGVAVVSAYLVTGLADDGSAPGWMLLFGGTLVLAAMLGAANAHNRWLQVAAHAALTEQLTQLAELDGLTGCLNHRGFHHRLRAEAERALRYEHSLWLLIIDLDDFKLVNDRYGHPAGDRLLMALGEALRRATRESDLVGRIGGDEFAVASPAIDENGAVLLARRVQYEIGLVNDPAPITASVGISGFPKSTQNLDTLLHQADAAAYTAKHAGRDRVVTYGPDIDVRPTLST